MDISESPLESSRRPLGPRLPLAFVGVLAVAGVALLVNLGVQPVWGSEGRWGCIARSMFESGDLFTPRIGTTIYWDKPLLSYWQTLPFAALLGDANTLAIRLPSALWALVLVVLTHDLARRWHGRRAAVLSGLVLAGTWGFIFWGRCAQVEMTNAGVILLVIWMGLRALEGDGRGWLLGAAAVAGLGANAKGLPAIAVPVFCLGLVALSRRQWSWLRPWRGLALAGVVGLLAFAAIPLAACALTGSFDPLALAWRENLVRAFDPFDHTDPWYSYFLRIFDLAAPWSLLLPLAVVHAVRRRARALPRELMLCAGVILIFSLSGSRRPYYLLPVLPFVAILVGRLLDDLSTAGLGVRATRLVQGVAASVGLLFVVLLPALFVLRVVHPDLLPQGQQDLVPSLAAFAAVGLLLLGLAATRRWVAYAWATMGLWIVSAVLVVPWVTANSPFQVASDALAADPRPCAFVGEPGARLLYEIDREAPVLEEFTDAYRWAKEQRGLVIVDSHEKFDPALWAVALDGDRWRALSALP